jgi:hypothetical protein
MPKEKQVQFRIDVDKDWVVKVTNLHTQKAVVDSDEKAFERALGRVGEDLELFPQPPEQEAAKITETVDNPHFEFCTTKDATVIAAAYQKILSREATEVVKFGRYLFATMIGDALWQAINNEAKTEPIELALKWEIDDFQINRLPWEMMHSKDGFLAAEPEVAVTRRVAGTKQTMARIATPRVLFVIGSDLAKDKQIKPGAEYLGLLRSLRPSARLRLKTHLLLQASPQRLRAAIKWFKPTVVHFICHGFPNPVDHESYLQLMADTGGGSEAVSADSLLKLLRPDPKMALPQIVILNACYTATGNVDLYMKSGQVASPMAMKLVAGDGQSPGVPIVVGMAGEVTDQACRLFTRCFYQAVLEGGEIAQAASAGRRLGIIDEGLTDPKSSIDWALPTLFMSAGVTEPKLQIITNPNEEAWHEVAAQFAPPDYPAFCDRLSFFEWYDCLMTSKPDDLPTPQQHPGDLQLLAVSLDGKEKKGKPQAQLGRTWLLQQFASNAALDGHMPVLNSLDWIGRDPDNYPTDLARLIADFRIAMNITANEFNLSFSAETLDLVARVAAGESPEKLPVEFKNAYADDKSWDGPTVQFAALRIDLLRLLEIGRKKLKSPTPEDGASAKPIEDGPLPKLLLLVDDIHQMDKATKLVTQFFSNPYGLRSNTSSSPGGPNARADIRVVCTYDLSLGLGEEGTITGWLDRAKGAREVPLRAFQQPEDRLAYEFFLSRWKDVDKNDRPLAVERKAPADFIEHFFNQLNRNVEGIPSRLKSEAANTWISGCLDMPVAARVLRPMNDEDRIKLIPLIKRGM